jgi:hypothetical protein
MAAKKAAATRAVSDQELEGIVRALVQRASGISRAEFKKELEPEFKSLDKRAVEVARSLAGGRVLHRWSSGKTKERYLATDPFDALTQAVATVLADGPLEQAELERRVEHEGRGLGDLVKEWLMRASARGELFQHAPANGSRKKRFGLQPDVTLAFKGVFTALGKALKSTAGASIPREAVLDALARELGLPAPHAMRASNGGTPTGSLAEEPPLSGERESFIRALRELSTQNVAQGLLPIRELRARLRLDKQRFDRVSLELSREGVVTLHHHDFPTSLSPAERADLVEDERGTQYVGIALRRSHG